MSILQALNS
jgi:Ca2+-binding EF-hand superfamily protein